jgi:Fic family protein
VTPFDTPRLMTELVTWFAEAADEKRLHPLLVIATFRVVFLAIHSPQDGNGRLSRILTTLMLLWTSYAYAPYSSLESVIEQSKEGYYLALRRTQGTIRADNPNWEPWLLLSFALCTAEAAPGEEDRARKAGGLKLARTFRAYPRSRARQHRRWSADGRQPQHPQGAFSATGG